MIRTLVLRGLPRGVYPWQVDDPVDPECHRGACYQTDWINLTPQPEFVYAVDYHLYIAPASNREVNQCDESQGDPCFWFYAGQFDLDSPRTAIHIGPQRGVSLAGDSGGLWRMNLDGYVWDHHFGSMSHAVASPVNQWARVRTWRLSTWLGAGVPRSNWGSGSISAESTTMQGRSRRPAPGS